MKICSILKVYVSVEDRSTLVLIVVKNGVATLYNSAEIVVLNTWYHVVNT